MPTPAPMLVPALTVNDLLRQHPGAGTVLNQFGIDTCCGGSLSLAEAAASVKVPLPQLLAAVQRSMEAA